MLRPTAFPFFYCVFNPFDSFAHASIISTTSRTVQNVFVMPAAIAGVHRIAMLDSRNYSSTRREAHPWEGPREK